MQAQVYNLTGTETKKITLKKEIFEAKINDELMAQAIKVFRSNQRKSPAKTLRRSQINRTTKKVYKQKGTGGARHGSKKAPIYVGGGVAHGPTGTQNYKLKLPKKMKIAALKSALSQKAKNKNILIVDGLTQIAKPKTKTMLSFLTKVIGENLRNISIVFEKDQENAIKSTRNINSIDCLSGSNLTTFEVIKSNKLIISLESLKNLEKRLGK